MIDASENVTASPQRSNFVSVVAWIFILLSGFATVISLMQNVMMHMVFPAEAFHAPTGKGAENLPAFALFMFSHMQLVVFAFFAVCATTFVCSIALLKRRNWARIVFLFLLALGIVWNLGGLAIQYSTFNSLLKLTSPPSTGAGMESAFIAMMVVTTLFVLTISGTFVWIIMKLSSSKIRAEFR